MASTNTTANYGLPQYVANDKPTYLGDFNAAMLSIDTAIKGVSDIATANQTGLASLNTTVEDQGDRLGTVEAETIVNTSDIATANQNITNLQSLTSTQGQQIATVTQTANASALVIGSGALSTEADKVIPAINEVNGKVSPIGSYNRLVTLGHKYYNSVYYFQITLPNFNPSKHRISNIYTNGQIDDTPISGIIELNNNLTSAGVIGLQLNTSDALDGASIRVAFTCSVV